MPGIIVAASNSVASVACSLSSPVSLPLPPFLLWDHTAASPQGGAGSQSFYKKESHVRESEIQPKTKAT